MINEQEKSNGNDMSCTSIIISCYKRTELIWAIINSIANQNISFDEYEIILADSHSCIENETLPERARLEYPRLQISIHHTKNILSAKRNLGRSVAKYEWLVFLDDDCIPSENWLKIFRKDLKTYGEKTILCGEVHYERESMKRNRFLKWRKQVEDSAYFRGAQLDYRNIVVMNLGLHRATFDKIGGFSELFIGYGMEDQEFGWRALKMDIKMQRTSASIYHRDSVLSFEDYFRKMYFNGRDGARHLLNHFPEIHSSIQSYKFVDPDYLHQSAINQYLFRVVRSLIFQKSFCMGILFLLKRSKLFREIAPLFLFRYLAMFSFIEGAKDRRKNLPSEGIWYNGRDL